MTWLLTLIARYRSQLFAFVGVLAVCGVGASIIAAIYIRSQNQTMETQEKVIKLQADTNKRWSQNWEDMKSIRQLDQQAVIDLQAQVEGIAADNDELADGIRKLEASNVEVKEFLGRRIPADLKRMLEQK